MKRLLGGQNLEGVLAVNWGVMNEKEGVNAFQQACQVEVLDCGLFLSKSGILETSCWNICPARGEVPIQPAQLHHR